MAHRLKSLLERGPFQQPLLPTWRHLNKFPLPSDKSGGCISPKVKFKLDQALVDFWIVAGQRARAARLEISGAEPGSIP